uniref:N-acetyltransferase domain-containing protein n=1 Tax=Anopheles stephensi TaxID=30069 RepID=A0A182YQV6_ANOST
MEPLRPASEEEIRQLIRIYEQGLPDSIQFVALLQNILRINAKLHGTDLEQVSHRFQKTVYVPSGESENRYATFVAISREEDLFVLMHSLQSPPVELSNAVLNTKYIKCDLKPVFTIGAHLAIRDSLSQLMEQRGLSLDSWSDCLNYWMPREEAAKLSYVVPSEVQLKPLAKEHARILNECWPYRYKTSQLYMESAIEHSIGLGLFDKRSGELVAWVFMNDHDAAFFTFPGTCTLFPIATIEDMEVTLAKALTRHIAVEYKQHVHTFIAESNERSIRLFEKIGFVAVSHTQWLVTN